MQDSSEAAPCWSLNVPAGHLVQAAEPAVEYVPFGHITQTLALVDPDTAPKVPAGHAAHVDGANVDADEAPESAYEPAGHAIGPEHEADTRPATAPNVFGGQSAQVVGEDVEAVVAPARA